MRFIIPIDGSSLEIHNKLREEFNKAIEVIRSFVTYDANVSTGRVVTKLNMNNVPNIIDLAVNLGVKAWVWTPFFPCGRGYVNKHLMLDPKDLMRVFNLINWKQKEIGDRLLIMRYTPGVTPLKMRSPTFKCGAINHYIYKYNA